MHKISFTKSLRFRFLAAVIGAQTFFAIIAGIFLASQQMEAERQKSLTHAQASLRMALGYVQNNLQSFADKLNLLAVTPALATFDPLESGKLLKTYKVASLFLPGEKIALYDNFNRPVANNSMVSGSAETSGFADFHQVAPLRIFMGKTWENHHYPVRTFAVTVQNFARANGVLTADYSFRRMQTFFQDFHIGEQGFVVLADINGKILWRPANTLREKSQSLQQLGLAQGSLPSHWEWHETKYALLSLQDPSTKIQAIAFLPQSEIDAQVRPVLFTVMVLMLLLFVLMAVFTYWLSGYLVKPIQSLAATMEQVREGNLHVQSGIKRDDEVGVLAEVFDRMQSSIQQYVAEISAHREELQQQVEARTAELVQANLELQKLSRTDELTKVPNRRDLLEKIPQELLRSERTKRSFALVLGDIDHFKKFNDTYGHDCGDLVLKQVAKAMQESLRKVDSIARWGGEEFLMMLPDTDTEGALLVAERVRQFVEALVVDFDGKPLRVTVSLGVAISQANSTEELLIQQADQALYLGKQNGRNRVELWQG